MRAGRTDDGVRSSPQRFERATPPPSATRSNEGRAGARPTQRRGARRDGGAAASQAHSTMRLGEGDAFMHRQYRPAAYRGAVSPITFPSQLALPNPSLHDGAPSWGNGFGRVSWDGKGRQTLFSCAAHSPGRACPCDGRPARRGPGACAPRRPPPPPPPPPPPRAPRASEGRRRRRPILR